MAHAISARFVSLLLSVASVLPGCSQTHAVELDVCGNRVVEPGEDCDGEAGCNAACRYACSAEQACPTGYSCDVDAKVCRTASGSFESAALAETFLGMPVAADLDGDEREDLLLAGYSQSATSSLYFFGRDRQVQAGVRLPAASSASAREIELSELPAFILSGSTIMAFQSKATRRPTPLISATRDVEPHARLFMADISCRGSRDLLLLENRELSSFDFAGQPQPIVSTRVSGEELDELESERPLGTLDAVTSFSSTATSSCDLLALPSADGKSIDLYGSLEDSGTVEVVSSVTLMGPPQRLFFVDWNRDGTADLYVVGALKSEIAYGVGDGRFHSDPATLPMRWMGTADNRTSELQESKMLVVANEGDGFLQLPGGDESIGGGEQDPSIFTDAFALDLTGDGRRDIAAVSRSRSLYVARTHPSGHASPVTLRTPGIPEIFGAADFDGDGQDDLLLAESANVDAPPEVVSALFAPMTHETTSTTELAEVRGIRQLLGGYLPWLDIGGDAAMSVLYTGEDDTLKLGYLSGGADRLLRSDVRSPIADVYAEVGALGAFSSPSDRAAMELAVLTETYSLGVAASASSSSPYSVALHRIDANGTRFERSLPIEEEIAPTITGPAAADRDGDGLDELYVPTTRGLAMLRIEEAAVKVEVVVASSLTTGVRAQDVNDDGRADVVVFDAANNTVWVLAAGASGFGEVHQLALAPETCKNFLNAATFVHLDQDGERELVINCNVADGIDQFSQYDLLSRPLYGALTAFDVDWATDRASFSSPVDISTSLNLTTGDFNGDGVEDIAGDGYDAKLLFGVPRE